jgi:hypothetical protein
LLKRGHWKPNNQIGLKGQLRHFQWTSKSLRCSDSKNVVLCPTQEMVLVNVPQLSAEFVRSDLILPRGSFKQTFFNRF